MLPGNYNLVQKMLHRRIKPISAPQATATTKQTAKWTNFLPISFGACTDTAPCGNSSLTLHRVHAHTIMTTVEAFWKNGSFAEHVPWEISGTCVDTKPRGTEATCIVSSFPVWATKTLAVARKQGDSNFVGTCLGTQLTTELNQNSLSIPRRRSIWGVYTG